MAKKKDKSDLIKSYSTKRCWSCNTHMKLDVEKCPSCGSKVGDCNEHGMAEKPVEWLNYVISFIAIIVFCYFIWWAFIKG